MVLRPPQGGPAQQQVCGGNIAATALQTHHFMRKENEHECGCVQIEFGSSNLADAGSLWIFLLESSVQSLSPCSA